MNAVTTTKQDKYEELKISDNYEKMVTRWKPGVIAPSFRGKTCVVIYHRLTNRFYGTIVVDMAGFYKKMMSRSRGYNQLALALRRMLDKDREVDIFCMVEPVRLDFEDYLISRGIYRVTTGRGELQTERSVLWKITCPRKNVSRYVCATSDTKPEELIQTAEKGITEFLNGTTIGYETIRSRLLPICSWSAFSKEKIFGEDTVVERVGRMPVPAKEYSAYMRKLNTDVLAVRVGLRAF